MTQELYMPRRLIKILKPFDELMNYFNFENQRKNDFVQVEAKL